MMRGQPLLAATVFLLASSGGAVAADLIGLVTDRSGRPQPNASVVLQTNTDQVVQTVTTNAQGQFLIPNIGAGDYKLKCGDTVQPVTLSVGVVRLDCRQ